VSIPELLEAEVFSAFFSKFPDLTETQKNSIPPILNGDDTLVISGTGSGKTEAVLAPLVSRYFSEAKHKNSVIIVYVAPTKALVNDVAKRISPVLNQLEMGVSIRHGDTNDLKLKRKHSVLVTTPESLEVLLATRKDVFNDVEAVVIDEAHLFFNQQRGFQLTIQISRIEQMIGKNIQVVAASATVASPKSLWSFFRGNRNFTTAIQTGHREIRYQVKIGYAASDLVKLVSRLPKEIPLKVLIFGETKRACDEIALQLSEAKHRPGQVFSHHASLSPDMRKKVEHEFNTATDAICVATSTLELGIDIGDINLIILYGKARNWQSFMQRIGRGNRRHQFVEVICALPDSSSSKVSELVGFQSLLSQIDSGDFPKQDPFNLYGVLCQQICVLVSAKGAGFITLSDLWSVFEHLDFLTKADLKEMLLDLVESEVLIKDPNRFAFGPSEKIHELRDRDLLWSNIPHSSSTVPLMLGSQRLGDVNSGNLFKLNVGSVFAFAAKRVRVVNLSSSEIIVSETKEAINSILKFGGKIQPLDISLVSAVRLYLIQSSYLNTSDISPVSRAKELSDQLGSVLNKIDLRNSIPYFRSGGFYHYITFGGVVLNSALSQSLGITTTEPNDFVLTSAKEIDFSLISDSLNEYDRWVGNLDLSFGALTAYQEFLSPRFRYLENLSKWHHEYYFAETLVRLKSSFAVEIEPPVHISWG
jgi:ATP-dependent Lhr-like helicase